jgi:hypothetical protein
MANFAFDEYVIIARADSKYQSMKDIVAAARDNPKKIIMGGTRIAVPTLNSDGRRQINNQCEPYLGQIVLCL